MARSTTSPGHGHNSEPLTEERKAALQTYHEVKIREAISKSEVAKAAARAAAKDVAAGFKRAKIDLDIDRYKFEEFLAKRDMDEDEFLAAETERTAMFQRGGLPVGAQQELALGDTADDQAKAYANGRRAYLRNEDPAPPGTVSPILHPDWMRGWQDEQTRVAMQMTMAEEVIAARAPATVGLAPGSDPDGDETDEDGEEDAADPEVIKTKARKLANSGWTDPTPAEAAVA